MSADSKTITINVQRIKGMGKIIHAEEDSNISEEQIRQAVKISELLHKGDEFYRKRNFAKALSYYKLAAKGGDLGAQLKVTEILEKYVLPNPKDFREKTPLQDLIDNLIKAGNQKSKYAQCRLALLYYHGQHGMVQNFEKAYQWFELAASEGMMQAVYYQAVCLLKGNGVIADIPRAITLLQKAVAEKNVDAMMQLADCYEKGLGVSYDPKQAIQLYQEALQLARSVKPIDSSLLNKALANIARCYASGVGVERDEKIACETINQIDSNVLPEAEWTIGNINSKIKTANNSDTLAFERFKSAADQGHVVSMLSVAEAYIEGQGTEIDIKSGIEYLKKAAARNHAAAILKLGKYYLTGFGVKKDHKKALINFKKAFNDLNHEPAMYYLGLCYVLFGDKEEKAAGFILLNSAANGGDLIALYRVGWCYMLGRGVEKSSAKAIEIFEDCLIKDPENIDVMNMLATALMFAKGGLQDRERAFQILKTVEAVFEKNELLSSDETYQMLARCYRFGYGTAKDDLKAIEYLQRSVALESPSSNVMLALCHFYGIGVTKNVHLAIKILKEMVNANCVEALNAWGVFALTGWQGEKPNFKKAFNLFSQASSMDTLQHETDAINNKGWCYLNGIGTEQNYVLAIKNFEEARTRGNRCAINNLAWCYLNGFGVTRNLAKAESLFLEANDLSHEENLANSFGISYLGYWSLDSEIAKLHQSKEKSELYHLAICYLQGWGVTCDLKKGLEILATLACESQYPEAMLKLGVCYLQGVGIEKSQINDRKAFELFSKAAAATYYVKDNNNDNDNDKELNYQKPTFLKVHAYVQLALCKMYGRGTNKNFEQGFLLLKTCSDMGSALAQYYLALLVAAGKTPDQNGIPDKKQAVELFKLAADRGFAPAKRYLAALYEQQHSGMHDIKLAFEQYSAAAALGDSDAENNLGILFETGKGTTVDPQIAFQYYERSARRGNNVLGWYNLARCYEMGIGTHRNGAAAKACYHQAALQGHERSEKILLDLESQTSESQPKSQTERQLENQTESQAQEDQMQEILSLEIPADFKSVVIESTKAPTLKKSKHLAVCSPMQMFTTADENETTLQKITLPTATFLPQQAAQQKRENTSKPKSDLPRNGRLQVNGHVVKGVNLKNGFHHSNNFALLR